MRERGSKIIPDRQSAPVTQATLHLVCVDIVLVLTPQHALLINSILIGYDPSFTQKQHIYPSTATVSQQAETSPRSQTFLSFLKTDSQTKTLDSNSSRTSRRERRQSDSLTYLHSLGGGKNAIVHVLYFSSQRDPQKREIAESLSASLGKSMVGLSITQCRTPKNKSTSTRLHDG